MKKSKLSIGLVTSFIAATALTACNEVTKNSKNLVTFKGYDGEERAVVTDEFYKEYLNGTKSISDLYDKVLEVMIRYEFGRDHTEDRNKGVPYVNEKKSLETIQAEAANDVLDKKQEAKDNAKANNTKYEKEWESTLNSYNCKNPASIAHARL